MPPGSVLMGHSVHRPCGHSHPRAHRGKWCQAPFPPADHPLTFYVGLSGRLQTQVLIRDLDGGAAVCTCRHLHGEPCQEQPLEGRRMGLDTRTKAFVLAKVDCYSFLTF